ncbi:hypothetical protein ACFV94_08550 [Streptomyces sp. NPDC059896]|uniref:hypothetical protein n=1 Tax=Streptomyces sp. NPDC059896 TaxID=3346993 RepID=UPI0036684539
MVWHIAEDGLGKAGYDFGQLPVAPRLQRELAEIFATRVGPEGTWRSLPSSRESWGYVKDFCRFLAEWNPAPESVSDITTDVWAAWRLNRQANRRGGNQIRKVARLLRNHPRLPEGTRKLMAQRVPHPETKEIAYSEEEFAQIRAAAARKFRTALHRIRSNMAHLADWRAGKFEENTTPWLVGEALDHLIRTGEIPSRSASDGCRRRSWRHRSALGGEGAEVTWMRLFLAAKEACALTALMVASTGWNAASVLELEVPDTAPDAGTDDQTIYRVELHKRRRSSRYRYETRNLTDWGSGSPGRLITQAIEVTAPARQLLANLGAPTERLLVWRKALRRASWGAADLFDVRQGSDIWMNSRLEPGSGISLNMRRLRRTVIVAHRRTPTQHSQETHDEVYVLPDPRTHADAQPVISDGVTEAVESARAVFRAQISRADTDTVKDTATTNCSDFTHSPFGEPGIACRASFLLCTACPNAVITPRHLPRLAYLLHVLDGLKAVLASEVWEQDWYEPYARLLDLRSAPEYTETEWNDALENVTARDREVIDQLLRKGYDT